MRTIAHAMRLRARNSPLIVRNPCARGVRGARNAKSPFRGLSGLLSNQAVSREKWTFPGLLVFLWRIVHGAIPFLKAGNENPLPNFQPLDGARAFVGEDEIFLRIGKGPPAIPPKDDGL
jgi:hypothetical protein